MCHMFVHCPTTWQIWRGFCVLHHYFFCQCNVSQMPLYTVEGIGMSLIIHCMCWLKLEGAGAFGSCSLARFTTLPEGLQPPQWCKFAHLAMESVAEEQELGICWDSKGRPHCTKASPDSDATQRSVQLPLHFLCASQELPSWHRCRPPCSGFLCGSQAYLRG